MQLGLFLLEGVLLPTEQVPLHVFEPRYRELIDECLENETEFGWVLADDDGFRDVGCRAGVLTVLEEFDDGRMGPFIDLEGSDLERKQEVELLRRAVALLPVEARELIVLRFMEEMSYAEIAKTVGSSEAALRGKVFRSLKLLREALEKKGVNYAV